jgi:NhaP-type Na+/H+ or K+/H+ antiporter
MGVQPLVVVFFVYLGGMVSGFALGFLARLVVSGVKRSER